uniref:histone acetyltransferase n=1 Tax=Anopheles merus TaxID=30066 RepID=A0A182UX01_ANOME
MPGKVNHVSEDRWRECIVDAISFVLRQKQSATLPRISFALRKRHNLPEDTVADRLIDAVSSGWIVLRVRGQETSYRVAKQQQQHQQQQKAGKVSPPPAGALLCIECLKPGGLSGPEPISSCDRCAIALHDGCANRSNGSEADAVPLSRLVAAGNRWYCEECKPCDGCSTANESLSHPQRCVVECPDCRRRFHFQCMNPPVRPLAVQAWHCSDCIGSEHQQTVVEKTKQRQDGVKIAKGDTGARFYRSQPTEADLIGGRIEAMRLRLGDGQVTGDDLDMFRDVLLMRCRLEEDDLARTPAAVRLGRYEIETWYSSPFPQEYAKRAVLHMCEFCLKYMKTGNELARHRGKCGQRCPPGWEIYRDGDLSVFEVDGNEQKLYCQSLCLLSKLFLDHKTLYFDVEPFLFYVLTVRDRHGHHPVGYFSKEKQNQLRYNVSCILTLPQYQRRGYGRFLIDFSYLLSRVERKPGTPERPLSELGQVSYRRYWCSVLLAYLYHNRDESLTLATVSQETGLIVGDIVTALRQLGFVRYRVERAGCIRTNRPFLCIDWDRVEQHHRLRTVAGRQRLEVREICLRWTPNLRLRHVMRQLELTETTPSVEESVECNVECEKTSDRSNDSASSTERPVTVTSRGRTRHRCRKYSDSIFDLSLSLTTGTPKSGRNVKPVAHTVPLTKRRRIKRRPIAAASFLKLPYIVLVPVKLSPAASGSPDAPSLEPEEISLDSVEAFMGTPKSEPQQKSSPEKQPSVGPTGGCFTPIAPFRQPPQHDDRTDATTTVGPEHCGTPKTTRGRPGMGSFAKCRKRMHDGELLLLGSGQGECKRLRLDEMIASGAEPDHRATEMGSVATKATLENAPVRQVWAGSARPGNGNRASLGSCSVEAKTEQCLIGRKFPSTV